MSMSALASVAESRIQEALLAGEDWSRDLAGKGKPLDLDSYFAAPSSLRAGFGMLKSAGVVPAEVEALREVGHLREQMAKEIDAVKKEALRKELMTRETELAMAMERMKRAIKADAVDGL